MSVLVTGASGLVGSHVVEALVARGEPVRALVRPASRAAVLRLGAEAVTGDVTDPAARSEEHTSELQSRLHLVFRLLVSKKKKMSASSRQQHVLYCRRYSAIK